jgi:hypothetical protein
MVTRIVVQEVRYRLGVVATKPCSERVSTVLSVLTVETRRVERADEPIGWIFSGERCQPGPELVGIATTVNGCLRPLPPLLFPLLLI